MCSKPFVKLSVSLHCSVHTGLRRHRLCTLKNNCTGYSQNRLLVLCTSVIYPIVIFQRPTGCLYARSVNLVFSRYIGYREHWKRSHNNFHTHIAVPNILTWKLRLETRRSHQNDDGYLTGKWRQYISLQWRENICAMLLSKLHQFSRQLNNCFLRIAVSFFCRKCTNKKLV